MVIREYQWNKPPYYTLKRISEAELAMLILADEDPRLYLKPMKCYCCPKIGRFACKRCLGEGEWYIGRSGYS